MFLTLKSTKRLLPDRFKKIMGQATPTAQLQKNKRPNQKMGQRDYLLYGTGGLHK